MTNQKENGPAGNGTVQQASRAWSYRDSIAAHRRRRDAALRLPPLHCSNCGAWYHDPLVHNCIRPRLKVNECPTHGVYVGWSCPFTHDCGCIDVDDRGHRSDTCTMLGQLAPRPRRRR